MGNVKKLMDAGIIAAGTNLNDEDQQFIEKLTDAEVAALISIKAKLTAGFIQRNLSASGAQLKPSMGIVF